MFSYLLYSFNLHILVSNWVAWSPSSSLCSLFKLSMSFLKTCSSFLCSTKKNTLDIIYVPEQLLQRCSVNAMLMKRSNNLISKVLTASFLHILWWVQPFCPSSLQLPMTKHNTTKIRSQLNSTPRDRLQACKKMMYISIPSFESLCGWVSPPLDTETGHRLAAEAELSMCLCKHKKQY